MKHFTPSSPPYDVETWKEMPFADRVRLVCQAWAIQGYGTPPLVYLAYALKVLVYVWVWSFFVGFTSGLGGLTTISEWMFEPIAFQKAILWSLAFEGIGLGCGSGPLTGRYVPPFGGVFYFLRLGTTKVPTIPGLPIVGGHRRSALDVLLYAVHLAFLWRALTHDGVILGWEYVVPTALLLPLLGLSDKTLYLAHRSEHYFTALVAFLFAGQWIAAQKLIWVAIWWGAASSKINRHFPSVVCVMISNSPLTAWLPGLRRRMYVNFPEDLRPSRLARVWAHAGTAIEFIFPVLLLTGAGGMQTDVALAVMLGFHIFITGNIPMGVPIEWNVLMVYGAYFLFGHHASVSVGAVESPILMAFLATMLVIVPVYGNLRPDRVSFLSAMRYYAGNWGYSIWLFRNGASAKLDTGLTKSAPQVRDQLRRFYDDTTIDAVLSKVIAFRCMHLHGRALQTLLPKAVGEDIDAYEWLDGEIVAGVVVGWNFGEGHIHGPELMRAVQAQCAFEEGELRCIFVESQPAGSPFQHFVIADAHSGVLETGHFRVADLERLQPWPPEATANITP